MRSITSEVTAEDALRDIRGFASARRIRIEVHARQRMKERGVTFADIEHALVNAKICTLQANGRWRVEGPDMDGDGLTSVVVLEAGVVVVTVF